MRLTFRIAVDTLCVSRGRPFRFLRHFEQHVKCKGAKYKKPVHVTTRAMQQYPIHGKGIRESKNTSDLNVENKRCVTISIQECALMFRGKNI